jgi:hypothetical protein
MRSLLVIGAFCTFWVLAGAAPVRGQIFEADFNDLEPGMVLTQPVTDPQPLGRPTNIVLDFPDGGDTIEIVSQAGNLTDQPLLLDARTGGISWAGFLTPTVYTSGGFSVSWDSLVLEAPMDDSEEETAQQGVLVVTRTGDPGMPQSLVIHERWDLRYTSDGTFEFIDIAGIRNAGSYTVGEADHFHLDFDLDSGAWKLSVNDSELLDGFLLKPFEFGGVVFMTNGRERTADPPPLAVDNLLVDFADAAPVLAGDYDASGTVEQADLDLVLLNWGSDTPPIPTGWSLDPPVGAIDQEELDRILLNWGETSQVESAAVPEPTTAILVCVLMLLVGCRLARQRAQG